MNPTDPAQPPKQPDDGQPDEQPLPIDPDANEQKDEVDEAADNSFPASDPPSYTRSSATRD